MSSDPSKTSGQFQSTTGSIKETLGNLTGSTNLQQSGKEQHAKGEAEYTQARTQGYAEGTKDRVGGIKDSMVGAVKGDESKKAEGNLRQDKGETQQDINH